MASIGWTGEATSPDRDVLVARIYGRHQMIHGEAERPLGVIFTVDLYFGGVPLAAPGIGMARCEGRHSSPWIVVR